MTARRENSRASTAGYIGCTFMGDRDTEEMNLHKEDINVHFALAMSTIHRMLQRIETVETLYKTAPGKPQ